MPVPCQRPRALMLLLALTAAAFVLAADAVGIGRDDVAVGIAEAAAPLHPGAGEVAHPVGAGAGGTRERTDRAAGTGEHADAIGAVVGGRAPGEHADALARRAAGEQARHLGVRRSVVGLLYSAVAHR